MGVKDIKQSASEFVESIANVVVGASAALPNATPSSLTIDSNERTGNVLERLLDLQVPPSMKWMEGPLSALGFSIVAKEVQGSFNSPARFYTVLKNAVGERAVWNIPKETLKDDQKWESIGAVMVVLDITDQTIIAVSEDLENPHPAYEVYKKTWLARFRITWKFVAWGSLQSIKGMNEIQQMELLATFFELADLIERAQEQKTPLKRITDNEVGTIAGLLAKLPEFIDKGELAWRLNLTQAGLGSLAGKFTYGGPVNVVAFGVISTLRDHVPLDDHPQDSVLGRFLCQVLTIADLNADDGALIRAVVRTYNLAPSFLKE